jgi:hypothetical protein
MSLIFLPENWKRFGSGRKWRCVGPRYLCEVDDPGNTPNYVNVTDAVLKIRRIKAFYMPRIKGGMLDENRTALDILIANAMAESLGSVPSPMSTSELRGVYSRARGMDSGVKLDAVVRYVAMKSKYLERREPGYVNPVTSPQRVSVGSHHVLISTARSLLSFPANEPIERCIAETVDLICQLPAESLYAAELAIRYFNKAYSKHLNQPPLLAATYNAGSPRPDPGNIWNLKQYGKHIDRWVAFYNTSRMV